MIVLAFSYPLAVMAEQIVNNRYTKSIYAIVTTWFGLIFLALSWTIGFIILRMLITIPNTFTGLSIIVLSVCSALIGLKNARKIQTNNIKIKIKHLKKKIRIVHLSDLHLGSMLGDEFLNSVVERTNSLNPDVVVITGDIIDGSSPLTREMLMPLNKLNAPSFYVIGNHDIYEGVSKVLNLVKKTKVNVLYNKVKMIEGIQIIGLEYTENKNYCEKMLNKLNWRREIPSVLLYHSPVPLKLLEKYKLDLHLAGHTHGGQIFPFNLFVKLFFRNMKGFYEYKGSKQYVSMGTGFWGPPMRLTSRNEIVCLDLNSKK